MIPFKKIFYLFTTRDKVKAVLIIFMTFIGAGLETIGVSLVAPFISIISNPEVINKNTILSATYKFTGAQSYNQFLIYFGASLLLFYIFKNFFLTGQLYIQNHFVFNHMRRKAKELFDLYMRAPYSIHLQRNSATSIRTITHDVQMMFQWVVLQAFILLGDSLVICIIFIMLLFIEPLITLLIVLILGSSSTIFMLAVKKKVSRLGKDEQEQFGQMIKWVNQGIGGVKEAKILGNESYFSETFDRHCSRYASSRRVLQTVNEIPRFFLETMAVGSLLIIALFFMFQESDIRSIIPVLALFAAASFRLVPAISRVVRTSTWIRHHKPSLDIVLSDLMEYRRDIKISNLEPIKPFPEDTGIKFLDEIKLQDVWFRYDGNEKNVLESISLSIRKGSSVAFVGPSGAGKTTVIDLILGLIKPTSGTVTADGVDIQKSPGTWQRYFGYIPQSIFLSDDTIRRNIAFGLFDDEIDETSVEKAVELAQLSSFIKTLPQGLDTIIGERGARLSGGQRQRIGVARALYNDPDILILDEATSSLDHETEQTITTSIENLTGKKTLIMIAHRLTTVERCDILFYLQAGAIKAEGTFNELLEISEFRKFTGRDFI